MTTAAIDRTATSTPFSTVLRETTMRPHREAESAPFIVNLMAGKLHREAYIRLLEQYELIYAALETAVHKQSSDPVLAPFADPGLERRGAIRADLDALRGPERSAGRICPATQNLAARLSSGLAPERLLAHHYLRYLGDLSGGLAIGRLMARHYGLQAEELHMWDFPTIAKPKLFKDAYRANLDALDITAAQRDALIDEAHVGFTLNRDIFMDLGAEIGPTSL